MLKPDRFSCSQKIRLKWDPPVPGITRTEQSCMSFQGVSAMDQENGLSKLSDVGVKLKQ